MMMVVFSILLIALIFIWLGKNTFAMYSFFLSFILSIWIFLKILPLSVPL